MSCAPQRPRRTICMSTRAIRRRSSAVATPRSLVQRRRKKVNANIGAIRARVRAGYQPQRIRAVPVAGSALARPTVARLSAMQSGNYARVNAQAVPRHDGGFGITVKGNTDLKGAHTASTATPAKDQLMTGTLSFSDIQNSASSFAINARGGVGVGDGGDNSASPGQTRGNNTMGC